MTLTSKEEGVGGQVGEALMTQVRPPPAPLLTTLRLAVHRPLVMLYVCARVHNFPCN